MKYLTEQELANNIHLALHASDRRDVGDTCDVNGNKLSILIFHPDPNSQSDPNAEGHAEYEITVKRVK